MGFFWASDLPQKKMKRSKCDSLSGAEDERIPENRDAAVKRIKKLLHPNAMKWSHKEAADPRGRVTDVDPPSDADLPQELHCPVCLLIQWDPVSIPKCGHELCRSCAEKLTTGKDKEKCPVCRNTFRVSGEWTPNRTLMRLVDDIPVHCPVSGKINGCGLLVQYGQLKDHVRTCPFRWVFCNAGGKCEKLVSLSVLREHREGECDFRAVDCPSCGSRHVARDLGRHRREECSQEKVKCEERTCDFTCRRCDIAEHERTCPKRFVACEMIGCAWQGTPETMPRHFLKDRKEHGEILLKRWETNRAMDHLISNRGDRAPVLLHEGKLMLSPSATRCTSNGRSFGGECNFTCARVHRTVLKFTRGDRIEDDFNMVWTVSQVLECKLSRNGDHVRLELETLNNSRILPSFCVHSVPSGKPLSFQGKFRCHYHSNNLRVERVRFDEFAAWKEWNEWITSPGGRLQRWSGPPEDAPVEVHRLVVNFYWASEQQAEAEGWKV